MDPRPLKYTYIHTYIHTYVHRSFQYKCEVFTASSNCYVGSNPARERDWKYYGDTTDICMYGMYACIYIIRLQVYKYMYV